MKKGIKLLEVRLLGPPPPPLHRVPDFAGRVMQDDIHNGYLIPKGSVIMPNIW